MKKYYYSDGTKKYGPLSIDELKQKVISKETLIWFEGLEDWTLAGKLHEMQSILELQPPPILSEDNSESSESQEERALEKIKDVERKLTKKGMFTNPFSFNGRIRRTEYGISLIIYFILVTFVNVIVQSGEVPIIGLAYIPILWFLWAQGAKRCHDVGNNGWWQIIPFYVFWLLFQEGQSGINEYGVNPKN